LSVTESVSKTCLAIPFFARLSDAQIEFVATSIREALNPAFAPLPAEPTHAFLSPTYSTGD
jgi:hypothetical protein